MKLSRKIKELREKNEDAKIKEELTPLIADAMNLEVENENLQKEKEIASKEITELKEADKKKQVEQFNNLKPDAEKTESKSELKYTTGPTEVKISDGEEEIKIDYRIIAGVGKTKGGFVFNGLSEEEPEKEAGKIYRKHEINGETFFAIYKR